MLIELQTELSPERAKAAQKDRIKLLPGSVPVPIKSGAAPVLPDIDQRPRSLHRQYERNNNAFVMPDRDRLQITESDVLPDDDNKALALHDDPDQWQPEPEQIVICAEIAAAPVNSLIPELSRRDDREAIADQYDRILEDAYRAGEFSPALRAIEGKARLFGLVDHVPIPKDIDIDQQQQSSIDGSGGHGSINNNTLIFIDKKSGNRMLANVPPAIREMIEYDFGAAATQTQAQAQANDREREPGAADREPEPEPEPGAGTIIDV
jgi:hypothetical protein